jgi:hypothetical protein
MIVIFSTSNYMDINRLWKKLQLWNSNSFEMTKESKLQVKKCDAGLKQKSGPVGAWSNYPVRLWSMRLQHWCRSWHIVLYPLGQSFDRRNTPTFHRKFLDSLLLDPHLFSLTQASLIILSPSPTPYLQFDCIWPLIDRLKMILLLYFTQNEHHLI